MNGKPRRRLEAAPGSGGTATDTATPGREAESQPARSGLLRVVVEPLFLSCGSLVVMGLYIGVPLTLVGRSVSGHVALDVSFAALFLIGLGMLVGGILLDTTRDRAIETVTQFTQVQESQLMALQPETSAE
jgi:hypothetical protein